MKKRRTQKQVLDQIDRETRRRLLKGEIADVAALRKAYKGALDQVILEIVGDWEEMDLGRADPGRQQYLEWKIGREQRLVARLNARLNVLRDEWTEILDAARVGAYEDTFMRTGYALDQVTPPNIRINLLGGNPLEVDAVLGARWKGAMFSDRIWNLTDDMSREIQNQVAQGVLLGEGIDDVKKRIRDLKVLKGNVPPDFAIERLARTEILKSSDRARERVFEDNKDLVEGELVIVTLDGDTCVNICRPLDQSPLKGKMLDSDEVQDHLSSEDAESRPPMHPNCRCTTVPVLKSWGALLGGEERKDLEDFSPDERVIRDPQTGRSVLAPVRSFDEWEQYSGLFRRAS